jgi:hypothetical protein
MVTGIIKNIPTIFITLLRGLLLFDVPVTVIGLLWFGNFDTIVPYLYIAITAIHCYTVWLSSPPNVGKKIEKKGIIIFLTGIIMTLGVTSTEDSVGVYHWAVVVSTPYLIIWVYILACQNTNTTNSSDATDE